MDDTGTTTSTGRPVEDGHRGGRPSPTRGWAALAALLGVYAIGALDHVDPAFLAGLLPGGH